MALDQRWRTSKCVTVRLEQESSVLSAAWTEAGTLLCGNNAGEVGEWERGGARLRLRELHAKAQWQ